MWSPRYFTHGNLRVSITDARIGWAKTETLLRGPWPLGRWAKWPRAARLQPPANVRASAATSIFVTGIMASKTRLSVSLESIWA